MRTPETPSPDQLDFVQEAESLVLANYESDQDIARVPDLSLQNLNLSADGDPVVSSVPTRRARNGKSRSNR